MPEEKDTLVDTGAHAATMLAPSQSQPRTVDPNTEEFIGARYADRKILGAGGMGEVRLCADGWIGRDVAMKVVRSGSGSTSQTRGRFLREARVQGQLEHPSIVPVYDIGKLASGEAFFTMKRIGGHTFERVILGLRENEEDIKATYSRRKLLSAMSQVCLTIAYAHSRGVVHRDLKPANVMLGDFGEVYVLDWGVAKIAGQAEITTLDAISGPQDELETHQGALVGTPGYMSPEQSRGDRDAIGPPTDIYALGAMLFELLALEPLHRGTTLTMLISSSLRPVTEPPSARAPRENIPPELDEICMRALALEPADRFPSARAMHEAIERFLDGERDAERRKELARTHVERALELLAKAREGGPDAEKHRAEGLRALGQATAFDPTDEGALRAISDIILAPFDDLPPHAKEELKQVELRDRSAAAKRMARTYVVWLGILATIGLLGVRNMPAVLVILFTVLVCIAYGAWMGSAPERAAPRFMRLGLILNFVLVGLSSFAFGPLVLTPGLAASAAAGYVIAIRANVRTRRFAFGLAAGAVMIPLGCQLLGLVPKYTFENGLIQIHPFLAYFPATQTLMALTMLTLAQIILPAVNINFAVESLMKAEQDTFAQAWRLRQLLPAKKS